MNATTTAASNELVPVRLRHSRHAMAGAEAWPAFDLRFAACRVGPETHGCDIVDVGTRTVDRWEVDKFTTARLMGLMERSVDPARCPASLPFLLKETQSVHVAQVAPSGHILINRGNFFYGGSFYLIDTTAGEAFAMADDADEPMLYTATGTFSPDYSEWVFVRWPARHSAEIINGTRTTAACDVMALDLAKRTLRKLFLVETADHIHQVTYSPDGRHLVFSSFKSDPAVPYPKESIAAAPDAYRASHAAGIIAQPIVTIDLATGRSVATKIDRPVTAHLEFDPGDPTAYFVSAHNFSVNCEPAVILEGAGGIFKLRLAGGGSIVEKAYAPDDLYRVSQHIPFRYQGRTLIAVTNTPNKLDIVDGKTMQLWRREVLFAYPELDFSATGSAISPAPPMAFFSINPSSDGRFIVLESSENFHVYALDEARFLDAVVPRQLPAGVGGSGHTRIVGR